MSEQLNDNNLIDNVLELIASQEDAKTARDWCESVMKRSDIFESRLDKSDELRAEGNGVYQRAESNVANQKNDYSFAVRRYLAAIYHIDFDIGQQWQFIEEHDNMVNERKVKIINNLCMVYLKQEKNSMVRKTASAGIKIAEKLNGEEHKSHKMKLYFRRAQAQFYLGLFQEAITDCKEAIKNGNDPKIPELLRKSEYELKKEEGASLNLWKGKMFKQIDKEHRQRVVKEKKEKEQMIFERTWYQKIIVALNCCRRRKIE